MKLSELHYVIDYLKKMNIKFENINNHIIPMDEFGLKWRFMEEKYNLLPQEYLDQINSPTRQAIF